MGGRCSLRVPPSDGRKGGAGRPRLARKISLFERSRNLYLNARAWIGSASAVTLVVSPVHVRLFGGGYVLTRTSIRQRAAARVRVSDGLSVTPQLLLISSRHCPALRARRPCTASPGAGHTGLCSCDRVTDTRRTVPHEPVRCRWSDA